MSTNGINTNEDTEMADCDGEKVVTMMDVLQEQQDFEEDANAVLGASDDKNCTYSKGYIKRQAIYACMTCCSDAKEDATKRAGVCLACSLSCHENHELVELYTKRNFRCDCGNPKFNSHPCQFNTNKSDMNEDNKYNQNYSGLYCICHRPYPDPESTFEDEMIQCIICEDWLHASHLDAIVPPNDQYSEMICKDCMDKNDFLHDYSNLAVKVDNTDIDVVSTNDVTIPNGHSLDNILEISKENAEQNISSEDMEIKDKTKMDAIEDDVKEDTISMNKAETGCTKATVEEETKDESLSNTVLNTLKETNDKEEPLTNEIEMTENTKDINESDVDIKNTTPEVTEKIDCQDNSNSSREIQETADGKPENVNSINITQSEINSDSKDLLAINEVNTKTEEEEEKDVENSKNDQEISITQNEINLDNDEDLLAINDLNTKTEEEKSVENSKNDQEISEEIKPNDTFDEPAVETAKNENPEDKNITVSSNLETSTSNTTVIDIPENKVMSDSLEAKLEETEPEKPQIATEFDKADTSISKLETADVVDESKLENELLKTNDITEENEMLEETENVTRTEDKGDVERQNNHFDKDNEVPNETSTNTNENKRKLSMDEDKDDVVIKKVKVDEAKTCVKPEGVKRCFRGATFWPSSFRQKLCTCNECLSMYKDLSVLFLIDPEDTVTAYEMLGKKNNEGSPSSQYEKGLQALSSLDRIQQINALTEYNKMRDKLLDFLKSFKDRKEIVKEEDIKAFFAGMKPKREPDGLILHIELTEKTI
ncbi:unnamed protein product, partial [Iphiclides podalirius]